MEGVTINNYIGIANPTYPIIFSAQINEGLLKVENFILEDSIPNGQQIFGGTPSLSNVTLTSFRFSNCTFNPNTEVFFIYTLHKIDINGFEISGVKFSDPTDTESSLISISLLDINNTYSSTITGI